MTRISIQLCITTSKNGVYDHIKITVRLETYLGDSKPLSTEQIHSLQFLSYIDVEHMLMSTQHGAKRQYAVYISLKRDGQCVLSSGLRHVPLSYHLLLPALRSSCTSSSIVHLFIYTLSQSHTRQHCIYTVHKLYAFSVLY